MPVSPLRLLLALALLVAFLALLLFLLLATDTALSVWERLRAGPEWMLWSYGAGLGVLVLGFIWLLLRLLRPRPAETTLQPPEVPDEDLIRQRLADAESKGVDMAAVRAELDTLKERREAGRIQLALLGDINVGKSSLIHALLPEARRADEGPKVSPRGGATQAMAHYRWQTPAGDELWVTDLPGLNEADGGLDELARDEALRAHITVFMVDGDLTRDSFQALADLMALNKPLVVAVNKIDHYDQAQQQAVLERIRQHLNEQAPEPMPRVVGLSAGGERELIRQLPDGSEERVIRRREPELGDLATALQQCLDDNQQALDSLRDAAVFQLAARKLDRQLSEYRQTRADEIVSEHTRKAVIGALAAVAPGTDLIIQGYLGVSLVKSLCGLYEVPVRQLDIERYIELAGSKIGRTQTLILAIAGNALKAFPGLGTLGGGLLHAIAYGIIFDSLGRAVVRTLENRGELRPLPAARYFEESLGDDLEARTRRFARLAYELFKEGKQRDR
ncbi:MAG: GTPase [Gammaproteobacteria bacterium]